MRMHKFSPLPAIDGIRHHTRRDVSFHLCADRYTVSVCFSLLACRTFAPALASRLKMSIVQKLSECMDGRRFTPVRPCFGSSVKAMGWTSRPDMGSLERIWCRPAREIGPARRLRDPLLQRCR